jgi:uncharacterized protein DUF3309
VYLSRLLLVGGVHPKPASLNLHYHCFNKAGAWQTFRYPGAEALSLSHMVGPRGSKRKTSPQGERMLIVLIILLLVFGFGGYSLGPGLGYYGGGGISLILLIVIVLLLLKVI